MIGFAYFLAIMAVMQLWLIGLMLERIWKVLRDDPRRRP